MLVRPHRTGGPHEDGPFQPMMDVTQSTRIELNESRRVELSFPPHTQIQNKFLKINIDVNYCVFYH